MINMSVKNIITVTNRGISPILSIAQGTDSVEFDFTVTDYDIPPDSSAVVYNVQPTGNVVNQLCSISGNTISVTPRAYFFLRGKNYMQFRITCNGKNLFSFLIEVWCSPNITEVEVREVQDPTVVTQVLSKLGDVSLKIDEVDTRLDNKIDSVDSRLGNRINNIVANNNPTEGNSELIDIRSGFDGTTYPSAGEAIRQQVGSLSEDKIDKKGTKQVTGLNTDFFETPLLFFGDYYHGYYITGAGPDDYVLYKNENYYSVIIDCKGGSAYHLTIPQDIGPEDGNYWVKIGTSSYDKNTLLRMAKNSRVPIDYVDNITASYHKNTVINTNAEAKTLIITVSKYQEPFVELVEGDSGHGYTDYNDSLIPLFDVYNLIKDRVFNIRTFKEVGTYDLNDIVDFGIMYHSTAEDEVINQPTEISGQSAFLLLNYCDITGVPNTTRRYQIMQTNNNIIYYRSYMVTPEHNYEWTEWERAPKLKDIEQMIHLYNNTKVSIEKENESSYIIHFGKYYTYLRYNENDSINAHLWNLVGVYYEDGENVVKAGTDIIGPIKEVGQEDFMGGVHGDETTTEIKITCDGVDIGDKTSIEGNNINIVLISELYRVSDKTHVYNRYVNINILNGRIRIENLYKCIVDDSIVDRATNGGLIAITNDKLKSIMMNNYFSSTPPTKGSNGSKNNVSATLYWKKGSITVNNIIGHENSSYIGFLTVFTNESPVRSKIYFDVIHSGKPQMSNGQEILGVFEYLFK